MQPLDPRSQPAYLLSGVYQQITSHLSYLATVVHRAISSYFPPQLVPSNLLKEACADESVYLKVSALLREFPDEEVEPITDRLIQLLRALPNSPFQFQLLERLQIEPKSGRGPFIVALHLLNDLCLNPNHLLHAMSALESIAPYERLDVINHVSQLLIQGQTWDNYLAGMMTAIYYIEPHHRESVVAFAARFIDLCPTWLALSYLLCAAKSLPSQEVRSEAALFLTKAFQFKPYKNLATALSMMDFFKEKDSKKGASLNTLLDSLLSQQNTLFDLKIFKRLFNLLDHNLLASLHHTSYREYRNSLDTRIPSYARPLFEKCHTKLHLFILTNFLHDCSPEMAIAWSKKALFFFNTLKANNIQIEPSREFLFLLLTTQFEMIPAENVKPFSTICCQLLLQFTHLGDTALCDLMMAVMRTPLSDLPLLVSLFTPLRNKHPNKDLREAFKGQEPPSHYMQKIDVLAKHESIVPLFQATTPLLEACIDETDLFLCMDLLINTKGYDRSKWIAPLSKLLNLSIMKDETTHILQFLNTYSSPSTLKQVVEALLSIKLICPFFYVGMIASCFNHSPHDLFHCLKLIRGILTQITVEEDDLLALCWLICHLSAEKWKTLPPTSLPALFNAFYDTLQNDRDPKISIHFSLKLLDHAEAFGLSQEDPLFETAMIICMNAFQEQPPHPFKIYRAHCQRQPLALSPPSMYLAQKKVALSAQGFSRLSQYYLFNLKDLPKVNLETWQRIHAQLSHSKTAAGMLEQMGERMETIKATLTSPYLSHLLTTTREPIDLVAAQFRAIVHYLSEQSEEIRLKILLGIRDCPHGKAEGISVTYQFLPETYRLKHSPASLTDPEREKAEEALAFLSQTFLGNLLSTHHSFLYEVAGIPEGLKEFQLAHHSLYLKNLLGPSIGLKHTIQFDQHTEVLSQKLLARTPEEIFNMFYSYATPSALVKALQQAVKREASLYSTFYAYHSTSDAWTLDAADHTELTTKGAVEILLKARLLIAP